MFTAIELIRLHLELLFLLKILMASVSYYEISRVGTSPYRLFRLL
jgi:hypothetical protein